MPNRTARVPPGAPVALTGTPGVGKSAVASALASRFRVEEVGELAHRHGAAAGASDGSVVDLVRLRRDLARGWSAPTPDVIVGHLAHLLPVRSVVVLRCRPTDLLARLQRAHRGTTTDRWANFVAEATDVVLVESLRSERPVYEIDTTRRTPHGVAREVARRVTQGGPSSFGLVDWLGDRRVTEHLLERTG